MYWFNLNGSAYILIQRAKQNQDERSSAHEREAPQALTSEKYDERSWALALEHSRTLTSAQALTNAHER